MILNSLRLFRLIGYFWLVLGFSLVQAEPYTLNIMAPLTIGDIHQTHDEAHTAAWDEFREQLLVAKSLGVEAVTTDLWWGLIEATEGYYKRPRGTTIGNTTTNSSITLKRRACVGCRYFHYINWGAMSAMRVTCRYHHGFGPSMSARA